MFIKRNRTSQPQGYPGLIETSVPAIGVFLPTLERDPIHGGEDATLASDGASDGLEGFAYKTTNASGKYVGLHSADSAYIPAQGYSLLVLMSSSLDGNGHGIGPRTLGGSVALRATPYIAGGQVAFDFGGATEGTTRCSASGVYTVGGKAFAFVCTTGARGMELWVDGQKKNSNTANPTRTQGSYAFVAGDIYGGTSGTSEYYLIIPFNGQLTTDECAKFSGDPWQIFAPRSIYIPVSAVGGAVTHTAIGALSAQDATIAGTAARIAVHSATGALSAQDATIAGIASRTAVHTATGALDAQSASIAGVAERIGGAITHTATGVLVAQESSIAGTAARVAVHSATGALSAQDATIAGTAAHVAVHNAAGALSAQSAVVAGTASGTGAMTLTQADIDAIANAVWVKITSNIKVYNGSEWI